MIYGANGFVGQAMAQQARARGLHAVLAGRNRPELERLGRALNLPWCSFGLESPQAMDEALTAVDVVLHCAGPYLYTSQQMVDACLRTGTHYLDITGEIPVYQALAARDAEAIKAEVMIMPGVGFDVVPTDCLAVHLKARLPSATHLALAFCVDGPAGLPPGTQHTAIELLPYGDFIRRNGRLRAPERAGKTRLIDFGKGPVRAHRISWGDVFTAYFSTGIANIEDYGVLPVALQRQMAVLGLIRPILQIQGVRRLLHRAVKPGPSAQECASTTMHVWGEVRDEQGRVAIARLHGPEAGVVWTTRSALAAVDKVLGGHAPPGFQTAGKAWGADFVLECEGVLREDL